jgi:hypothetical protein
MPVHDWARVDAGIFHAFHTGWVAALQNTLNDGLLTGGYYALAEQHAGHPIMDVLALHASAAPQEPLTLPLPPAPDTGGMAVAEAPPRTRRKQILDPGAASLRRSLAIRHVSGHRLVALVEIVSPANEDRARHIEEFTDKILSALNVGVHVLLVHLFPPGRRDPDGLHGALRRELDPSDDRYELPNGEPLTLASYAAGPRVEAYLEHVAVGAALPEMPLFLRPDRYVNVPLEPTYQAAYRGLPAFWREVLEGPSPSAV